MKQQSGRKKLFFLRILAVLLILLAAGCSGVKGYSYETGVYARTQDGRHILMADNGYDFLLHGKTNDGEETDLFSKLEPGDVIRVQTACVPYVPFADDESVCVINVYEVQNKWWKHTDLSEETTEKIELEFRIEE